MRIVYSGVNVGRNPFRIPRNRPKKTNGNRYLVSPLCSGISNFNVEEWVCNLWNAFACSFKSSEQSNRSLDSILTVVLYCYSDAHGGVTPG